MGTNEGYYPWVGLKISTTNGGSDADTTCVGPSSYSVANAETFVKRTTGPVYSWAYNVINTTITQASDFLLVGAFPYFTTTKIGSVFVRKIQIVETPPLFTITPLTKTIACGTFDTESFEVNNIDNPQGTLTYDWNLGNTNNGWIYQGGQAEQTFTTTTNAIQLTPSSTATSLSNVSVTVKLNGNVINTLTSNVTLSNLPLSLTASQLSCTDLQLNVSGGIGNNYNWTSSDGDILLNGTSTTANTTIPTIAATGRTGFVTVSTTTPCGVKSSGIFYDPFVREAFNIPNPMIHNDHLSVSVNTTPYDTYYRWYVNGVLVKQGENATTYCTCYYESPDQRECGNNTVRVEVDNCNSTSFYEEEFEWICSFAKLQTNVELFPNPARDQVAVRLKDINDTKMTNQVKEIKEVRILNKLGNLQRILRYANGTKSININLNNLSHDIYYIEVTDGVNNARLQLSIQK